MLVQLQQDADFQHWGVDFGAVHQRAEELGINLIRRPVCTALHTAITTILSLVGDTVLHNYKMAFTIILLQGKDITWYTGVTGVPV